MRLQTQLLKISLVKEEDGTYSSFPTEDYYLDNPRPDDCLEISESCDDFFVIHDLEELICFSRRYFFYRLLLFIGLSMLTVAFMFGGMFFFHAERYLSSSFLYSFMLMSAVAASHFYPETLLQVEDYEDHFVNLETGYSDLNGGCYIK